MPRKSGRGGARQGTPGTSYANRTDLQAPKVLPIARYRGNTYGTQAQQVATQQAAPAVAPAAPASAGGAPLPASTAGQLGDILGPTARPNEPVTHGITNGPGGGPEVLNTPTDPDVLNLREIYRIHPTSALRDLLESMGG